VNENENHTAVYMSFLNMGLTDPVLLWHFSLFLHRIRNCWLACLLTYWPHPVVYMWTYCCKS